MQRAAHDVVLEMGERLKQRLSIIEIRMGIDDHIKSRDVFLYLTKRRHVLDLVG